MSWWGVPSPGSAQLYGLPKRPIFCFSFPLGFQNENGGGDGNRTRVLNSVPNTFTCFDCFGDAPQAVNLDSGAQATFNVQPQNLGRLSPLGSTLDLLIKGLDIVAGVRNPSDG